MTISLPEDDLVLGRGTVYFDPFVVGTRVGQGERYIGHTINFQVNREVERQIRMLSVGGRKFEDTGRIVRETHKVTFITENIDLSNLSDFFGANQDTVYLATGFASETLAVRKGRFYQLGKAVSPFGLRNTLVTAVRIGGVSLPKSDWSADDATGRLFIPLTSTLTDGTTVTVDYETRDQRLAAAVAAPQEVWGALRFLSDNAEGVNKNVFLPCVRLFARGAVDFKGDQWQQLPFEAEASNLTPFVPQIYVDLIDLNPGKTEDVRWLEANPIFNFTGLEDSFDTLVNVDLPLALTINPVVYTFDSNQNIEEPPFAGALLTGTFDLLVDGIEVYRGLNAPFVRPDLGATTIKAFRSTLDANSDYVLLKNGQRLSVLTDDTIIEDDMVWSVGNA